jgi:hypothetical protein
VTADDAHEPFRALFEQWRGLAPSAEWTRTLEGAYASHSAMAKTMELSLEAWRDLASTPPGAEWSAKLERHAERIQRQAAANVEAATRATPSPAAWSDYLEYLSSLDFGGWNPFKNAAPTAPPAAGAPGTDAGQLSGLVWDAYQATFGRAEGAPAFGPGRELNEALRRAGEAWAAWARAAQAYGEIMSETWRHALERFLEELASRGEGEAPASLRDLTRLFMEVAERHFVARFAEPDYVEAQARALEAGLCYRKAEQDLADVVYRHGPLPSRAEVDGAHRRVYDLKQEVHALREEVRQLRGEVRAARAAAESERAPAGDEDAA